jgi:hypothetical protein
VFLGEGADPDTVASRSHLSDLQAAVNGGKLRIETSGDLPVLDFEKGAPITVVPMSNDEFFVDGGDHTRLASLRDGPDPTMRLMLNNHLGLMPYDEVRLQYLLETIKCLQSHIAGIERLTAGNSHGRSESPSRFCAAIGSPLR